MVVLRIREQAKEIVPPFKVERCGERSSEAFVLDMGEESRWQGFKLNGCR